MNIHRRHRFIAWVLPLLVMAALGVTRPTAAIASIDAYKYDATGKTCSGKSQVGATALLNYMASHYIGSNLGTYACRYVAGTTTLSEHGEGRALDWALDDRVPVQKSVADEIVASMLKKRHGHKHALARRMGIQTIIWDCQIWTSSQPDSGLRAYGPCDDTTNRTIRHEDHVHFGLNWAGALKQTGFWANGAWGQDLSVVKMQGAAGTESHPLDGATAYSKFLAHRATAQGFTDANQYDFLVADYNKDFVDDLWVIKMHTTGTNTTEVHILDGATSLTTFLLHTGTAQAPTTRVQHKFVLGDYNNDGRQDIFVIKMNNTGTSTTEVHVLDGASKFSKFLLHTGTAQGVTTEDQYSFASGDYNRDGRWDLYVIKQFNTGTDSTEIHVLNGANKFASFLLHTGTALAETDFRYAFTVGDYNDDGKEDIYAIKMNDTGTNSTEVHVLNGSTFSSWLLHTGTELIETGWVYWDFHIPVV